MRPDYDFARAARNPHAKRPKKKTVTIRLDEDTIAYFKGLSSRAGLPYQTLINLYLRDCAAKGKVFRQSWRTARGGPPAAR